jgi:hypothetical protein
MKISLKEHGGLAAGMSLGKPARVVDTDALPAAKAQELEKLVSAAVANPPAARDPAPPGGDRSSYVLSIEDGRSQLLHGSVTNTTDAVEALLDWLRVHAT